MVFSHEQRFLIVMFIVGLAFIVGQKLGWKIFSDPPDKTYFYSHTVLKKIFGRKFLGIFNYILGVIMVVLAVWGFIESTYANALQ